MKVATVLGTRPEIIRLSEVIKAFDKTFDHTLIHTGQNWDYTLNEIFFEDLGLRSPDVFLKAVGQDLGETIGNIISASYSILKETRPEALLVLGDTNSALSALAAKRLKIPIFHMEAGNRCFDQNVPEEINRKLVDHLADINLPYTEHSRRYLLSEGFQKERIFVTGSPMTEVLDRNRTKIDASGVLKNLGLSSKRFFVVSLHREENLDIESKFTSLIEGLNAIAEEYQLPMVLSTHPRTLNKLQSQGTKLHDLIDSRKPLGFSDYVRLQKESFCVLSDSGTLSEESNILGFPAVLMRTSTERPEVIDKGSLVIGGVDARGLLQGVRAATELFDETELPHPDDYRDSNVSIKVVKIVQSYTSIVNERVWGK